MNTGVYVCELPPGAVISAGRSPENQEHSLANNGSQSGVSVTLETAFHITEQEVTPEAASISTIFRAESPVKALPPPQTFEAYI